MFEHLAANWPSYVYALVGLSILSGFVFKAGETGEEGFALIGLFVGVFWGPALFIAIAVMPFVGLATLGEKHGKRIRLRKQELHDEENAERLRLQQKWAADNPGSYNNPYDSYNYIFKHRKP